MSQVTPAAASTPGADLIPDSTGLFTAAHLIWIVVFALAAIAIIGWGMHLKRRRKAGERKVAAHNENLRDAAPAETSIENPAPARAPVISSSPVTSLGAGPADGPITQLKGLGPKVAQRLGELGITTVGEVAALTDDDAAALDAQLGAFSGRMGRDRWLEQARFLAAGDKAGFEAVFGKL